MATKVKGDKIKEGSIPLSALSEEIKNNMGGADWNAAAGEAGYIENRTHYINWYNKPENENYNDLLLGLKDKTPILVTEDGNIKIVKYLANECFPMYENGFEYFNKNWKSSSDDILDGFVTYLDIIGGGADPRISTSIDYDEDDNEILYVTIKWNTDDTTDDVNRIINQICMDYYIVPYHNYTIQRLNHNYLPNTVLKTTPQTLTTTAKNQALANLGIDPVVWKYLTSPISVLLGDPIPQDLLLNGELKDMPPHCYYFIGDMIDGYHGRPLCFEYSKLVVVFNKTLYLYYADENGNWARMEY